MKNNSQENPINKALGLIDLLDFTMENAERSQIEDGGFSNGKILGSTRVIPYSGMRSILNSLREVLQRGDISSLEALQLGVSKVESSLLRKIESSSREIIREIPVSEDNQVNQVPSQPIRVKTIPQEARGRVRELVGYSELEE